MIGSAASGIGSAIGAGAAAGSTAAGLGSTLGSIGSGLTALGSMGGGAGGAPGMGGGQGMGMLDSLMKAPPPPQVNMAHAQPKMMDPNNLQGLVERRTNKKLGL